VGGSTGGSLIGSIKEVDVIMWTGIESRSFLRSQGPAHAEQLDTERREASARSLLARIATGKSSQEYEANQCVFAQGDAADAVFYVLSGRVKLTVVSARGKEAVVGILGRGSFFGEGCLAGQAVRMSTASVLQSSTIVRVNRKMMVALFHREPEFAELFIAYLVSRSVRVEADLVDQLFNSSEKRLARLLLLLAPLGKTSTTGAVTLRVTQETLASMVGTTRARVSYFMNRFRKMGFVDYGAGGLKIHSDLLTMVLQDEASELETVAETA
jgi:CRP/FNR family transcriptional regulator, cyclic AMP receptor protein